MKTIQMTIEEQLLARVDLVAKELGTSRSAFMREALQEALKQIQIKNLENQHKAGYEEKPVENGEFDIWDDEQIWGTST